MAHAGTLELRRTDSWLGLVGWIALCNAVGISSALATASGDSPWYQSLEKPSFNPPSWVFGPVWTALYVLMGIAAWRVWRRGGFTAHRAALTAFLLQLALNFGWSFLFFEFRQIELALLEIVLLWAAIVATMALFRRVDQAAAWLLAPYLGWVTFATVLNAAIANLN